MERIIRYHARASPDKEAIVEGLDSLTFAGLLAAAERLVHLLYSSGRLKHEEPVGIILAAGLHQVVAQVAVRLAGGTCVPLDRSQPIERLKTMLQQVHAKKIVLIDDLMGSFPEFSCVSMREFFPNGLDKVAPSMASSSCEDELHWSGEAEKYPDQRSHILFTSGSTGKPKPVQINERGIIHLAFTSSVAPRKADRVSEFNSPGFDLSLFEIWITLLSGATIVVIPNTVVTDPSLLSSFITSNRITVTIIPTALFNIIVSVAPGTFQGLRHVVVAGETANVQAMRSVLESHPPQHLWNGYGPTEATTMATLFEVTLAEVQRGRISIGFPVGEMKIYLVDDHLEPIWESGMRGEICIAGPGKSPGYIGDGMTNAESFITIRPNEDSTTEMHDLVHVYRTGDLGEWRTGVPGCLDFIGRQDTQVKHRGFRVELEEIERVLEAGGLVSSAVAMLTKPRSSGLSVLVAYAIPSESKKGVSLDMVSRFARENLPAYMVPDRIELVSSFPLTANGKVNRQTLPDFFELASTQVATNGEDKKSLVVEIWKDVLGVSHVRDDDDFFLLGASSMQSAACIAQIRDRLGRLITLNELRCHSQLSDLLRFLEIEVVPLAEIQDDSEIWKSDIDLVDELSLVPDWNSDKEGRVFMTGATGFLGVHMLHHLLNRPGVKQVACLARRKGTQSAAARVQSAMERYDLYPLPLDIMHKILVLEGDMAEDHLGLGPKKFDWLTNWASVVFHVGAKVNFCESYQEHYRDNVLGTRNVLNMAVLGRSKGFHYMSSIDVWGPTGYIQGTREVLEDEPLVSHLRSVRYDLGYGQSQWTAEGMVRRMQERGLPITIYRPGFIIGDSRSGAGNPDDFVSRLIVGCIQMGSFPCIPDMRLEYSTIDFVLSATMHIASSNKNFGSCYHLLSPDQAESITVEETCDLINDTGYPVKLIEYSNWVDQVLREQHPDGPLAPLIPLLQERVLGQLTRWEISGSSPRYDTRNALRALADSPNIKFIPFTPQVLRLHLDFWNRKGFYKV